MTVNITDRCQTIVALRNIINSKNSDSHKLKLRHKDKTVEVHFKKENKQETIWINPNPSDRYWIIHRENMSKPNWGEDIVYNINKTLFKNKSKDRYKELFTTYGDIKKTFYWVVGTDTIFYFTYNNNTKEYKLYRERKNISDDDYKEALRVAGNNYGYKRGIIDDNYVLQEWDLERIKDTNVTPEEYKKNIIIQYKGKHISEHWSGMPWSYEYKYFFTCPECGKNTFEWRRRSKGAMIDYFGEPVCKDCEDAYNAKKEAEEKRRKEEHDKRMLTDPDYKREQDKLAEVLGSLKIHRVVPQLTMSKLVKERPMERPHDTIKFLKPCFGKDE